MKLCEDHVEQCICEKYRELFFLEWIKTQVNKIDWNK